MRLPIATSVGGGLSEGWDICWLLTSSVAARAAIHNIQTTTNHESRTWRPMAGQRTSFSSLARQRGSDGTNAVSEANVTGRASEMVAEPVAQTAPVLPDEFCGRTGIVARQHRAGQLERSDNCPINGRFFDAALVDVLDSRVRVVVARAFCENWQWQETGR